MLVNLKRWLLCSVKVSEEITIKTEMFNADMFESVNKKTPVHPLYKVGFSVANRLPEELRLNSDG